MPHPNSFNKNERLCSRILIEKLFNEGTSFLIYPIKVVYYTDRIEKENGRSDAPLQVLISVSKKKFRRAAHRNKIKRLMRESYRTHKSELTTLLIKKEYELALGLIYIGDSIPEFGYLKSKIISIMKRLNQEFLQIN
ncbi:MAG: ribonuclease P protein component [Bacteroidales bacterium]|nr:ribonuclease P protein component [Bacteroidales bacterium]